MSIPRIEVLTAPPAHYSALDFVELEHLDPDTVLDLSVNSNPCGPSPTVCEALAGVPLGRYPDREALGPRRALADRLGVSSERILAGNGTAELLWPVALAFLHSGDRVLVIGPMFGEYTHVAALMSAQIATWTAQAEQQFVVAPEDVVGCLRQAQPRVVFLCNPNNPTGTILLIESIAAWARPSPGPVCGG